MYVCICKAVTEDQIRKAMAHGATTLKDLNRVLGVAGGCGSCATCAKEVLKTSAAEEASRHCDAICQGV